VDIRTEEQFKADRDKAEGEAMEKMKGAVAKNVQFLEENKVKPGVKTTASGLQYEVLTQGTGANPKKTDIVKVHYKGTLIDGKEFDSSYKRNEPAEFPLNAVIPGWTEGLQLMKIGSKYKFTIPAALAYGAQSPSPNIPPNSTLQFEVELLSATPAPPRGKEMMPEMMPNH
jgi:FKBP-type peptidyl-prolyl cis-trans isomerase